MRFTNGALGEALAQPFITKTFGVEGKTTTQQMVVEIEKAFERNLDTLAWMDAPTREQALVGPLVPDFIFDNLLELAATLRLARQVRRTSG